MKNFKGMVNKFLDSAFRNQLQNQATKLGIKGRQAIDILALTSNTIKEILQAEVKNGNYAGVVKFLKSPPVQMGTNLLADKIMQRLVSRLILRFGLPGGVAVNVATLLLPFLLKRLSKKALNSGNVQDLLHSVGITKSAEKLNVLKNIVKNKFSSGQAA